MQQDVHHGCLDTGGFGLVTIGGCKHESGFIDQSEAKMVVIYKRAGFSLVTL